jgi:hypothetical protein
MAESLPLIRFLAGKRGACCSLSSFQSGGVQFSYILHQEEN